MIFKNNKKLSQRYGASHSGFQIKETPMWNDLWRLFWWVGATFTLMSLLSYSPTDPSWTTWSSQSSFANWMGRTGSIVSDILFQLFGIAAFLLVGLLVRTAKHSSDENDIVLPRTWFLGLGCIFLVSLSALLEALIPRSWLPWQMASSGGLAGGLHLSLWKYFLGPLGAVLISFVFTLATSIVLFRWKALTQLTLLLKRIKWEAAQKGSSLAKELWACFLEKIKARLKKSPPISSPTPLMPSPVSLAKASVATAPIVNQPEISTQPAPEDEEIFTLMSAYDPSENTGRTKIPSFSDSKPKRKSSGPFQLPPGAMLTGKAESKLKPVDRNWYHDKATILVEKLKDFGVAGEVVHISPGPVITVYEFKPASGVKIKEIANLSDDLTLALSVLSVRIVAPIPGKPVVGIEIPSPHREMVFFKDLIQETPFYDDDIRIPIALGRLASGEPVTADLAAMPHLLVAGATGTGKSVFINTLISSLLFRFTPQQLKLILVDPKMVELSLYEGIPHLLLPVVVDSKKAALALRWAVDEMERRYTLMHQAGVRHIDGYNARVNEMKNRGETEENIPTLPYIVVVIDEYADLMAVVPKDVELSIARLAQKARASGIHLVLATQRPSTDVVTGTIKANFPSRISFRVASSVDAKTILDRTGSERLLGQGDMLFHSAGFATLKRMQGAYISDADLNRMVDFLKAQGEPEYDEKILQAAEESESGTGALDSGDSDEGRLYDQAVRLVTEKGEASISLIQRHLRIGYNRAAMLMEQLEKEGVVAPSTGTSKRRTVLVSSI
ncbi:DNA translocase FtsK [bacterium]|nr:DNA translocase FtsK [bacterium]